MTDPQTPAYPTNPSAALVWFPWVAASVVGWGAGGWLGATVVRFAQPMAAGAVGAASGVLAAGVCQWMVLHLLMPRAQEWIGASVVSVMLVGLAVLAFDGFDAGLGVAVGGPVLGVCQWAVLRHRVRGAGWWIAATPVAWVVGGFMSGIAGGLIGWAILGAVIGALTGAVLAWLLRRPRETVQEVTS